MDISYLQTVADNLKEINKNLEKAETLVSFMSAAGEEVATLKQQVAILKMKKDKWEQALKEFGYSI